MAQPNRVKEEVVASLFSWVELILVVAFIMALFFLFDGDPDIWDLLHQRAVLWLKP